MHRGIARLTSLVALGAAALAALLLGACGPRAIGQGVVLWGTEGGPASGSLLPVVSRSSIDSTVTLWDRASRSRLVVEQWRVRSFDRLSDAQGFQASFQSYRDLFAFTDRSAGLPVRERPDTGARREAGAPGDNQECGPAELRPVHRLTLLLNHGWWR